MRRALLLLFVLLAFKWSFCQAVEGKVAYQKTQQPAAVIELPYPPEMVEHTISEYLSKKGGKGEDLKGFRSFRNMRLSETDTAVADLYFKIDPKSRKEKDKSIVYLVAAKPNEDVSARSTEDRFGIEEAKAFLNGIVPSLETTSIDAQIKGQEENVKKAEKKLSQLADEGQDLMKKKMAIEQKILENQQGQERQKVEIEKQRGELQSMVSKRKG